MIYIYRLFYPAVRTPEERINRARNSMLDTFKGELPSDLVYEFIYEASIEAPNASEALNFIFTRHNVGDEGDDNRPLATERRSMSVGDVVLLADLRPHLTRPANFDERGQFWAVLSIGWQQLHGEDIPANITR